MTFEPQPRGYADTKTGEVYDLVAVPRSQSRSYNTGGFFMGVLVAFDKLADERWPAGDYQVFVKLLGRLDWENFIHINVKELAEEMGRSRQKTSAAISRLEKAGVLHRGPRVGRSYTWRMNPDMAWRGKPDARRRMQRELDSRGWEVVDGPVEVVEGGLSGESPLPGL